MIIDENLRKEYEMLIKKMEMDFTENLISLNTKKEEYKKSFIEEFIASNKDNLMSVAQYSPKMFLKTISDLRHPQFQYEILNIESENLTFVTKYLDSLNDKDFNEILKKLFAYPLDVTLEEYYRKWVGKSKIHVKFAKKILGKRYEKSKEMLKQKISNQYNENDKHFNGINFDYYRISLEKDNKNKEKTKENQKIKKTKKNNPLEKLTSLIKK